jgi:hypothetical protein
MDLGDAKSKIRSQIEEVRPFAVRTDATKIGTSSFCFVNFLANRLNFQRALR